MTSTPTRIAFIGFGEAGRAFAESLTARRPAGISAYDILLGSGDEADMRAAAGRLSVDLAGSAEAVVSGTDIVISAVTAAQSLIAAQSVAGALGPGQIFIDINSVSPERKRQTAALIEAAGAVYVDMAVMTPVQAKGHQTAVLIAGTPSASVTEFLDGFGFDHARVGDNPGDATAIKMIRSLFVKGLEALTVQSLTAASTAGVYDRIFASLSGSFPGLNWDTFASYQFERMTTHGLRRAAELRETAATFAEFGFAEGRDLATAVAQLQELAGQAKLSLRGVPPRECAARLAAALKPGATP